MAPLEVFAFVDELEFERFHISQQEHSMPIQSLHRLYQTLRRCHKPLISFYHEYGQVFDQVSSCASFHKINHEMEAISSIPPQIWKY